MIVQKLFDLRDKVAVVTGGGRGIGRFIATGLAEAGANVVLASRKVQHCADAAKQIERLGVSALPVRCDLEKVEDVGSLVETVMASFKHIDILVNNAGLTWGAPTLEYPLDKWDKVLNVNLRALFLLSQKVAGIMVKQGGGKIINITSVLSVRGATEEMNPAVAYNASKGAINALTFDLAVKLAKHNIQVNGIAPGYFDTDLINYAKSDKVYLQKFLDKIPMSRLGGEDDIKGAAVFLASHASDYVSGHILSVDGGYLSW
jgi:NAD(P)-dependent dehydrogenase (short-subunit alcohol dehydrogenase family)